MAKPVIKPNVKTTQILDDLEKFLDFCRSYGYRYNETDLYNFKSYAYQQYHKFTQGKNVKDMWLEDSAKFGRPIG
jgi:hypothetical protein